MNNTINAVSFSGNMAKAYLQKKAKQQAQLAAEKTKDAARFLINSNKKASKNRQYIGTGAYFGNVPLERPIVKDKAVQQTATQIEPNLHFFG